jgi:hypothetical protein
LVKLTKSLKIHLIEQRTGKYKYKYSELFSLRRSENIKTSKQPFFKPESGFRHLPASDTKTSPPHEPISDLHHNTFDHIHLACPNVNPATSDGRIMFTKTHCPSPNRKDPCCSTYMNVDAVYIPALKLSRLCST